jgi:FlaA1/EpsC-like NDP-sugar epimerase
MSLVELRIDWSFLDKIRPAKLSMRKRRLLVFLVLTLTIFVSVAAAFLLRFDFTLPTTERSHLFTALAFFIPLKLAVFYLFLLHRGWWTSVSVSDVARILVSNLFASATTTVSMAIVVGSAFPRSVYAIDLVMNSLFISMIRLMLRVYREMPREEHKRDRKNVLIYGAGHSGARLMREISSNPNLGLRPLGFLDDDPDKRDEMIHGVRVLGTGADAVKVVKMLGTRGTAVDEILIAMPSANGKRMREAISCCRAAEVACRTLPSMGELLTNKRLATQIRDVSVEDLLCREQVNLDELGIRASLTGQSVMITGAAGSIGSELATQIAAFQPRVVIVLDRAESDLFRIDLELRAKYPGLPIIPEICDITDADRLEEIIRQHRVDCIFHAAAYKHVPLMEAHPIIAVRNNVIGTWVLAQAALTNGVKRFVMISSDKAVNPVNVMGATKRVSELLVGALQNGPGTTSFVSVRFGNVLASNGSVVPIFQRQIAAGGPVTVTHPEVQRYFMTIRESVQLVLQASTMGRGGEIFVLDMGEPVKIADLARNMIRLAGLVPGEDIDVVFTGLRPGEKLFEELITEGEAIMPTHHEKIKIFQGPPEPRQMIENWIAKLRLILASRDEAAVIQHMKSLVPEYQISPFWEQRLDKRRPASVSLITSLPLSKRVV